MSLNDRLELWVKNIEETRQELLANAAGFNPSSHKKSWWQRNFMMVFMWVFVLGSMAISYYLGWTIIVRVFGIMLILMGVQFLWKIIKKGYGWLRTYLALRKLSRQVSRLRKEF